MLADIINFIVNLLTSIIQVIVWPINQIIVNTLPDLSDKIVFVTDNISDVFSSMSWGLGLIPTSVVATILFILSVEVAKYTIYISTHIVSMCFSIFKRIKFW